VRAAASLSEGMLANTADAGGTEFNTVDGTLWFLHALDRHVLATGDVDLAAALADDLAAIVEHHVAGTRFGIRVDPADGLITQGADGWALTWMDARVDGQPVTARRGKPVEVNALWVNGLAAIRRLFSQIGRDDRAVAALEARARASFGARFSAPGRAGLADVVDGPAGDDWTLRPNQLLAVSLPYAPVVEPGVVAACAPLVTSVGLRSLSPADPGFRPLHRGGPAERDAAYHQGTVWPWLIGPYVDALLAVGAPTAGVLDGLEAHVREWGLGSVSETADGAAPHAATGCPFQAWSVAELIRARARLADSA
jgi:predicted glycogen debranching enzyme